MFELKFDRAVCEDCTTVDCLVRCQYMDFDVEEAKERL
jgi:hypothetical protein